MPRLLHAITTPPDGTLSVEGLRGEPLRSSTLDGVILWCTHVPDDIGSFTREDLLGHHRIVTAIFGHVAACLPARFGTLLTTIEPLRDRTTQLQVALERVRDACELAVTAAWLEPGHPETGRAYLLQRLHATQLADAVEREIGPDLVDSNRTICPSAKVALSLAMLVKRESAERVKSRVPRTRADVRILVNGPWPPYTFASVGSE